MKTKRSIKRKIILYIASTFVLFFVASLAYIVSTSRSVILNETIEKTRYIAKNSATDIEKFFESNFGITRTLAQAFTVYETMPAEEWQDLFLRMYLPIIKGNDHVYIIWDSWEYAGFVPNYPKDYGRLMMYQLRETDGFTSSIEERSMDGDPDVYGDFKQLNMDDVWEPYLDEVEDASRVAKMMTTIATPIQVEGKYRGMIGLDVELTLLQQLVDQVETLDGGYAFLVSPEGVFAGHPQTEWLSRNIGEYFPKELEDQQLLSRISKGEEFFFLRNDGNGDSHYVFFSPITVKGTQNSWSLGVSVPYKQVMSAANKTLMFSLIVGVFALLVVVILLIVISNAVTGPIVRVTTMLKRLSLGELSSDMKLNIETNDEVGEMAFALNQSIDGLTTKLQFAQSIGMQKLDNGLELLSEQDTFGKSLLEMRDSLKRAEEEEQIRKVEDDKRKWTNEGLNFFAEILRKNQEDFQLLSDDIVSNLVRYLGANQAVLFLLQDEQHDPHYILASAYAWDRKKFLNKRVELDEGLVGACGMEKETIQLTEIPEDYMTITSGLGKANPGYIVLVPLKQEEKVLGVLEIASFKILETFELEFLERLAHTIASTLLSVKINEQTRHLLEQSQQQAEEMLAQEEEMRQNMEELQATQEEMGRKADEQRQREEELVQQFEEEINRLKQELEELRRK